jgi:hypothetical protein
MKSFVRGTLLAAAIAMLGAAANPVSAQGRDKEIRLDMLAFQTADGSTLIEAGFPGTLALGFYMNPNFALEPQVGIASFSGDGASATVFSLGLFAPYYFKGDTGRTGFFVSPGVSYSKATGDFETDGEMDYGVDLGIKMAYRERISTRLALTYRDGDSFSEAAIGASFGVGLFWR